MDKGNEGYAEIIRFEKYSLFFFGTGFSRTKKLRNREGSSGNQEKRIHITLVFCQKPLSASTKNLPHMMQIFFTAASVFE